MQADLEQNFPQLDIHILGVNERGHEVGNSAIVSGRDLPWLQDIDANSNNVSDVWYDLWDVTYRDVIILDRDNSVYGVYNLTTNNLAESAKYQELRDMLVDAAMAEPAVPAWQNPNGAYDVNNDLNVSPLDALLVINHLDTYPGGQLPPLQSGQVPPYYLDVSGDNLLSPLDALLVINNLPSAAPAAAHAAAAMGAAPSQAVATVGDIGPAGGQSPVAMSLGTDPIDGQLSGFAVDAVSHRTTSPRPTDSPSQMVRNTAEDPALRDQALQAWRSFGSYSRTMFRPRELAVALIRHDSAGHPGATADVDENREGLPSGIATSGVDSAASAGAPERARRWGF